MGGKVSGWLKRLTRDDDEVDALRLSGEVDASGRGPGADLLPG